MRCERSPTALRISIQSHITGAAYPLTRHRKRKVQARQHDGDEDPPAKHTRYERSRTRRDLQPSRELEVPVVGLEEGPGEQAEGDDEREEDHEEADVCAQRADEVDEAEYAHGDEEEG